MTFSRCSSEFPNDNPLLHRGATWICATVCGGPRATRRGPAVVMAEVRASEPAPAPSPEVEPVPEPESAVVADVPESAVVAEAIAEAIEEAIAERKPEADAEPVAEPEIEAPPPSVPLTPMPMLSVGIFVCAEEPAAIEAVSETESEVIEAEAEPDVIEAETEPDAVEAEAEPAVIEAEAEPDVIETEVATVEADDEPDAYLAFVDAVVQSALEQGATRGAAALRQAFECVESERLPAESAELLAAAGFADDSDAAALDTRFVQTARAWRQLLRGETDDFATVGDLTLDGWAVELVERVLAESGDTDAVRRALRGRGVAAFGMLAA